MDRAIPDPGFSGDDGSAPAVLTAALAVYAEDPAGGYLPALAALCSARVLVPVVALGEESTEVEMATVLLQRPDGARALLAFTATAAMAAWNAAARPVPTTVSVAALSAVQEEAQALLLDVAGPVRFAVETEDLHHLARGRRLVRLDDGDGRDWDWDWVEDVRSQT